MRSSTSHPGSFDRRLLALLFAGIAGAPLLWLLAIQAGYVLAYQACDARSTRWVTIPTFAVLAIDALIATMCIRLSQRARHEALPMPLMGWLAAGMAALMTIALIASAIAPVMLQPCD